MPPQDFAGIGAARACIAIGTEQLTLNQAGEGEGAIVQVEGLAPRGGGQVERPARCASGGRQRIALIPPRIAKAINQRDQTFKRLARQCRFRERAEHSLEIGQVSAAKVYDNLIYSQSINRLG